MMITRLKVEFYSPITKKWEPLKFYRKNKNQKYAGIIYIRQNEVPFQEIIDTIDYDLKVVTGYGIIDTKVRYTIEVKEEKKYNGKNTL